jgi:chorismate mutase
MNLARRISEQKRKTGLPVWDVEREEQVKETWMTKAESLEIGINRTRRILKEILEMSKEEQKKTLMAG